MFLEEALKTHLAANAALTALVSARIYPGILPQNSALPAVVYQKVSAVPEGVSHDGPAGLVESRLQFSVMGAKYSDVKAVSAAVKRAMRPLEKNPMDLSGLRVAGAYLENETDIPEPNDVEALSRSHVAIDYLIQHEEDF